MFDEVPVGTLAYRDACGSSDTLYARRTGRGVAYRVWNDGYGDWTGDFDRPAPLTRVELAPALPRPALAGRVDRGGNGAGHVRPRPGRLGPGGRADRGREVGRLRPRRVKRPGHTALIPIRSARGDLNGLGRGGVD